MAEPLVGEVRLQTMQERPALPMWDENILAPFPVTKTATKEVVWDGREWREFDEIKPLMTPGTPLSLITVWFGLLDKVKAGCAISHEEMCSIPSSWRLDLAKRMILQK